MGRPMAERRYFFDGAASPFLAFAGAVERNLASAEEQLGVQITIRDCQAIISGDEEKCVTAEKFLEKLVSCVVLRNRKLDQADFTQVLQAFRQGEQDSLTELFAARLHISGKSPEIVPRTRRQLQYLRSMADHPVVFGVGPAGTGKTYLAMAMAVSEFLKGNVSRIILPRPAREAGEVLGFLPGTLEDKISPYLRPLYDALYALVGFEDGRQLIEHGAIELAPLAFMRGRTLNNAFIILDEAQNTSRDQMLMLLTRMGFDSRCVVTGDPTQNDLSKGEKSGLEHALRTLKHIPEIAICRFSAADVVRNPILEKIINAYADGDADRFGPEEKGDRKW